MSQSREDSGTTPPSFLPLFHSHNIALDEVKKDCEVSALLDEQNRDNISESQEDLLNGNLTHQCPFNASELSEEKTQPLLDIPSDENILNKGHISFAGGDDENNKPDVFSLVPQSIVDSVLNNNDNNSNNGSISDLTKHSPVVQVAKNEHAFKEETNQLTWEAEFNDDVFKSNPPPSDEQPHSSPKKSGILSGWRKLTDAEGIYYWNIDTGATQYEIPEALEKLEPSQTNQFESVDSSLADLQGAALRYASLHLSDDDHSDREDSNEWTTSTNSDDGRIFSVRSLGWLPLDHFSGDPEASSSAVNACIKHLSSSHGQIMDGIGAWGEGKDLMLLIEDTHLKLLDPVSQTVLQTQLIKQIRVWGVGGNNPHDFAYVAKDSFTRQYKCHVFRCDASAKAIARELHNVCENLPKHRKSDKGTSENAVDKEKLALSTNIPEPKVEPSTKFAIKYLAAKKVQSVNGITTIKNVIRDVTTDDVALCEDCVASVSASALLITRKKDNFVLVNCRMRCLSFMGIGDDISLFAFIVVVADEATCHVIQCEPNAAKLALSVQEACMLRFQKAVDARHFPGQPPQPQSPQKSFRSKVKDMFTRKKSSNK